MKQSALETKVSDLIRPVVEDLGFALVLVEYAGGILSIFAEDPATGKLGLEDCAKISRAISGPLEEADPITSAYRLEISSPGIDRPLIEAKDYRRFAGFEAKIELDMPLENGQRRFRGVIRDEKDGVVTLVTDTGEASLPLHSVSKAKLVMSDELIKATKNGL
jgi:ribosome maturation factor RimP